MLHGVSGPLLTTPMPTAVIDLSDAHDRACQPLEQGEHSSVVSDFGQRVRGEQFG
jgi:hypothetical protein